MDFTKTRRPSLAEGVGRHIGSALYLLGAEMRFKSYCAALYLRKRPYIIEQAEGTLIGIAMMYVLASMAQVVM